MVDRLRAYLDRPLDPSAARAMVALGSAILVGLAALFVLASSESDRPISREDRPPVVLTAPSTPIEEVKAEAREHRSRARRQDPQDKKGSAAAQRAAGALRSHRALQHVPYREGEVAVLLVGARKGQAVLRISAASIPAARRGWLRFLRRYRDPGQAYLPIFRVVGGGRNG